MTPILIRIEPWNTKTSAREFVRMADGLSADVFGTAGIEWKPGVTKRPQISSDLMSPDLDGRTFPGRCEFEISLSAAGIPPDSPLKWEGAPVLVSAFPGLAWPGYTEFNGTVMSIRPDDDRRTLQFTCEVDLARYIEKPLLTLEFSGGGGVLGDPEKKGTPKPAGFGVIGFIEPVWFDSARWIGMIDGYGNTVSISRLMEGASDLGPSSGNYASYAALAAAIDAGSVPRGSWATCIAEGLVGLGAPAAGVIQVDAVFGSNRMGAMMKRMVLVHAAVPVGLVAGASFDAIDSAMPYDAGWWTGSQVQIKDVLERMSASVNSAPILTPQGTIGITQGTLTTAVATLDLSASQAPRVVDSSVLPPQRPIWRLRARTARPARVLTYAEVNAADTIVPLGLYDAGETYRYGNIVKSLDLSEWFYSNSTPGSGHAPPTWPTTSNAYWYNMSPPASASYITYGDGTPIENLKPGEPGANVTEGRTAAAIFGQGLLATKSLVTWNVDMASGGGKPADNATVGANWNSNVSNIPYASITNVDDASALGFNANFEAWPGTYPDGWGAWSNGVYVSKSTTTVRSGLNSVRMAPPGSVDCGINRSVYWVSSPAPAGTFLFGTVPIFLETVVTGLPGILVRLFTNSGLTLYRDTTVQPAANTGAWQNIPWVAGVQPGEQIFGMQIFLMGSWSIFSSGHFNGVCYFDAMGFTFGNQGINNSSIALASNGVLTGGSPGSGVTYNGLGGGLIGLLGQLYFGDGWIKETSGGATATLSNFKTILGQAGSLFGQGLLATQDAIDLANQVFGYLTGGSIRYTGQSSGDINDYKPLEGASDVTSAIIGGDTSIAAAHDGTITETMPKTTPYHLSRQGTDVTTSAAWAVSIISGTFTASIGSATGILSINTSGGVIGDGEVEITATLGATTRKERRKVTRQDALPPASGASGGSASGGGFSGNTAGSNIPVGGPVYDVIPGGAGKVALAALYDFTNAAGVGTGPYDVAVQWARWNGASYTLIGSEVQCFQSFAPGAPFPGQGNISYEDTGLAVGVVQRYRLYWRNVGYSVDNLISSGISSLRGT